MQQLTARGQWQQGWQLLPGSANCSTRRAGVLPIPASALRAMTAALRLASPQRAAALRSSPVVPCRPCFLRSKRRA